MEMTENELLKAMDDSEYFHTLTPAQKLHTLIQDVMRNGSVKKKNYNDWLKTPDKSESISQEEKLDEILDVLQMEQPGRTLVLLDRMNFMQFCLPKCFPLIRGKRTYSAILRNFDACTQTDLSYRVNVFFFPFDTIYSKQTMLEANFDPETVDWMIRAIEKHPEFIQIKSVERLKEFLNRNGIEFYYYINEFATSIFEITMMREFSRLDTKQVVDIIINRGDPLFLRDLKISKEDLLEAGIKEADIENTMNLLMEHCLKKPADNTREQLLKYAMTFNRGLFKNRMTKGISRFF